MCVWIPEYFRDGEPNVQKKKDGTSLLDVSNLVRVQVQVHHLPSPLESCLTSRR